MRRFIFVLWLGFIFLSVQGVPSFAAHRPLSEILTYSEFASLVQFNSRRVPDFHGFWRGENPESSTRSIFWGGGSLRGFLHWHFLQLQTHTPAELRTMPIPHIADMMPLGGKDVDLFGPAILADQVRGRLPALNNIDYISTSELEELVKLGGPTLEKMALNPFRILDPALGFRHYYDGLLVFLWSDENQFINSRLNINDYSKTGEALRFIRFAHFNLPELTPYPKSVQDIQTIAEVEGQFIQREDRLAWIEICLEKLFEASQGDLPGILNLLHHYNLLAILGEAQVMLPESHFKPVRKWLKENRQNLSAREIAAVKKILPSTLSRILNFPRVCAGALTNLVKKTNR